MRKDLVRGLLALCLSATTLSVVAQPAIPRNYVDHPGYSVGINFGMSDLWGDVGTKGVIDHYANQNYLKKPTFMGGILARYSPHPSVAGRVSLNYGRLYATDAWNEDKAKSATSIEDDAYQRYLRNQDARADMFEGTFMLEIMPLRWNSESKAAGRYMQPYITGGVGGFYFNPQTTLIDRNTGRRKWVNTIPLHLEMEGINPNARATSRWQLCFPVGLGLRWDINNELAFGVEYLYRFTMTDRLDNVSSQYVDKSFYDLNLAPHEAEIAKEVYDKSWYIQPSVTHAPGETRGNKDVMDGYSTFSFMLIYKFESNKIPWWY